MLPSAKNARFLDGLSHPACELARYEIRRESKTDGDLTTSNGRQSFVFGRSCVQRLHVSDTADAFYRFTRDTTRPSLHHSLADAAS
jgi:hypothetical protein